MRIGYLGDGPWAHAALSRIRSEPDWQVVFMGARHKNPDAILRAAAAEMNVPFLTPAKINAPEVLAELAVLRPDVLVSMSYDQIARRPLIDLAPRGMINVHAGALPFYRGRNVLNWVLINGETSFGVTCHYVDEGIDTGDIIVQRHVPIDSGDDYADILKAAFPVCADVLHEALRGIAVGSAPRIRQSTIDPVGFYCGRRGPGDEILDWTLPAKDMHNFIRGVALPGPGARVVVGGRKCAFLKSRLISGARDYIGTLGEVVGVDAEGIVVKCSDATLRITSMADVVANDGLSAPFVPSFRIGTRFSLRGV